jgi:hypothetical protein
MRTCWRDKKFNPVHSLSYVFIYGRHVSGSQHLQFVFPSGVSYGHSQNSIGKALGMRSLGDSRSAD